MKILIDSSNANYNWGDASMLHMAIERIERIFPDASILLIGSNSSNVANNFSKRVRAVPSKLRQAYRKERPLLHYFDKHMPQTVDKLVNKLPALADNLARAKMHILGRDVDAWGAFHQHLETADLLIVAGGGFINDLFEVGEDVLNVIQLASSHKLPVFMFGQGIGPISSARLWTKAARAFSNVDGITVREKCSAPPLLHHLGVPEERITVTGDDSVELAYRERPSVIGSAIGINVRAAYYSEVGTSSVDEIGRTVGKVAQSLQAPLSRIPIAFDGHGSDVNTLDRLLKAADTSREDQPPLDSPQAVIKQVGQCRVVVTGSYHGGVFALSQGIPVVALSQSTYYDSKFHGLADMFGTGCSVLRADEEDLSETLNRAIHKAWKQAPDLRPELLESARRQAAAADAAYSKLHSIVG